jgi:hypothetical protein
MTTLSLPSFLEYNTIQYTLLESNSYLVVEPAVITHNMKLSLASFSLLFSLYFILCPVGHHLCINIAA